MSIPKIQHFLPIAYLKHFAIDKNNPNLKSMVFCGWIDNFGLKRIQVKSINGDFFKKEDFYTTIDDDPYKFEGFFSKDIEPLYNIIIEEIEKEKNLSQQYKENLITWLFFNKYRTNAHRQNFERIFRFAHIITYAFSKEHPPLLSDNAVKFFVKKFHLHFLFNSDAFWIFFNRMADKRWHILKASDSYFITNDDPGFSIHLPSNQNLDSLTGSYSGHENATNYYIISPKYCLMITPPSIEVPGIDYFKMPICYHNISNDEVNAINLLTFLTRPKYLISNNKSLIERYINRNDNNKS